MKNKGKIKVAILAGGRSSEHDVSMISGRHVLENIDKEKYLPLFVKIPSNGMKTQKLVSLLSGVDVVFVALHGADGENGSIQGLLETMGVPYTGPGVLASAIGINKHIFKMLLKSKGIAVPRDVKSAPCFVKPLDQGSSIGTSIVMDNKDLSRALSKARRYSREVLIEEYIEGIEVTCGIIGNNNPTVLPIVEILPLKGGYFDYQSKYTTDGATEIVPAKLSAIVTKKVQRITLKIYKLLGCRGFSRVDFIINNKINPIVLEINTIPGLTPASLLPKAAMAAGISNSLLVDRIIQYALER